MPIPFWQQVAPNLRFVVCVRNPLDAAASLQARDGTPLATGTALWHLYTILALSSTKPEERIMVHYEDMLIDYRKALEPVLDFCGLSQLIPGSPTDAAAREFVDPGLKHHFYRHLDAMDSPEIAPITKELYSALVCRPYVLQDVVFEFVQAEQLRSVRATIAAGASRFAARYSAERSLEAWNRRERTTTHRDEAEGMYSGR